MPATGVPADAFARRVTFALRNDQHRSTLVSSSGNFQMLHLSAHITRSHDAWPVSGFRCWAHHSLGSLDIESLVSWRNTDVSRKSPRLLWLWKEASCIILLHSSKAAHQPTRHLFQGVLASAKSVHVHGFISSYFSGDVLFPSVFGSTSGGLENSWNMLIVSIIWNMLKQ